MTDVPAQTAHYEKSLELTSLYTLKPRVLHTLAVRTR